MKFLPICCEIKSTTQKIGENQIIKFSYYKPNIIMDVSSVAFNRNIDNPPKVENINATFYTFVGFGFYVIAIADKSLRYCIDNPYCYENKYITSNYFTEFNYADPVIVDLSYKLKCFIITNDKYKQYVGTPLEDWLKKIRIPFKIIDGKFNLVAK